MRTATGFSLLEILIALLIVGIAASFVMPRLVRRSPNTEWSHVHEEMNNMLYYARQEAITTQKIHRLVFDQKKKVCFVEVEDGKDAKGRAKFAASRSYYFTSSYDLPEQITLTSVVLKKKNLLAENKKRQAFCYVVPHGLVQNVTVMFERSGIGDEAQAAHLKLRLEPFLGTFDNVEQVG